uniref:Uncharacterized protein n=1 Tax=Romanomermis culicivorax TaxID=13658 RepID=A0A915HSG5_ROMCU
MFRPEQWVDVQLKLIHLLSSIKIVSDFLFGATWFRMFSKSIERCALQSYGLVKRISISLGRGK